MVTPAATQPFVSSEVETRGAPSGRGRGKRAIADQLRRTAELDALRIQRPLTDAEKAEADNLAWRAYMRGWRADQAAREQRLAGAGR